MPKAESNGSYLLYWCFTLNNPVSNQLPVHEKEKYVSWQLEEGANGTPHLQGYVEFTARQRISSLKKWLPTAHFEPRRGTAVQARDYTRKEDSRKEGPWERGTFAEPSPGSRTDLEEAKTFILEGASEREAAEKFPDIHAKYPQFVRYWLKEAAKDRCTKQVIETFRPWQQHVKMMCEATPDPREILWVYDPKGNTGKTMMAKWLVDHMGAFYTNGGKHTDIVHAYNMEAIVVFDYVRESEAYVNYGVLEQLKNGICFSPKYESGMKRFEVPHVIVFANFYPATNKLSEDRLVVIKPSISGYWDVLYPHEK